MMSPMLTTTKGGHGLRGNFLKFLIRTLFPAHLDLAIFVSPPEGGLDLVTNRKGAILGCYLT
jgi:hypothetical protein